MFYTKKVVGITITVNIF